MQFFKRYYGLILVLILSFWAVRPLSMPGFFPMHDNTQVARVFEMAKVLKEGVFPVRWVPDLGYGYGYPIFNFYAPLAYYVGAGFMLLGFDALVATKLMMVLGVVLAGVFMYFLAREFFGELGGIVSALFYLYAPYHAIDIYVRGDVAEFWAYAFIPLAFSGVYKVFQCVKSQVSESDNSKFKIQNSKLQCKIKKFWIIGSLGYAGIILSHNLTALMVTPFLLIVILLNCYIIPKGKKILILYHSSLIFIFGLVVSAFYWIPALLEMKYTNVLSQIGGGADFRDHFVCAPQLWSSVWGFGGSTKGCMDGMSFMIGKLHIVTSITALMLAFVLTIKNKIYKSYKCYIIFLSVAGFILAAFLTLELSKPIWEVIPLMAFFQYPWRFLILTSFSSSFLVGFIIWVFQLSKPSLPSYFKPVLYIPVVFIFLLLFFNLKFFVPQTIFPAKASDFTNESALKWTASKVSDEYLAPNFSKPKSQEDVFRGQVKIRAKETNIQKISNMISIIGLLALILGIILLRWIKKVLR